MKASDTQAIALMPATTLWNGQCIHCTALANYVVLDGGSNTRPVPIPAYLGPPPYIRHIRSLPYMPLYCRQHAYEKAGIPYRA